MNKLICTGCGIATQHKPNEFFENKKGNEVWLMMCFNTDFVYYNNKKRCLGKKYQCIINSPATPIIHGPSEGSKKGFNNDWIFFDGEAVEEIIKSLELPVGVSFDAGDANCLTKYINDIKNEEKMPTHYSEHYISQRIYAMLVNTARQAKISDFKNSRPYETMVEIRLYMSENYCRKLSLQALAERASYSVSRFCELYRQYFDSSPILDLMNMRVNKAKQLLLSENKLISEIAAECGFDSIHYFSNTFKKIVGCSPKEYRYKN